jgi:hypothetical protein
MICLNRQRHQSVTNRLRRTLLVAAALASIGLVARAQPSLQTDSVAARVQKLKPGDFLWAPEAAPEGPVLIIVSLKKQRAYVYRNGIPIGITTVSTGKPGLETPTGVFTILQKEEEHTSNLYDNAPMPLMQRLTWSGVAMHAGHLPGYPASHGCIRLPQAFAKLLYDVTKLGMTVVITDQDNVPRIAPTPNFLTEPNQSNTQDTTSDVIWSPELSPQGPLSIVVSAADKKLVVLRNGVLIGSTSVAVTAPLKAPRAYSLRAVDEAGLHWLQIPLFGRSIQDREEDGAIDGQSVRLSESFRTHLMSVLVPGATLVLTPDTLNNGGAGESLTVVTSEPPTQ